MSDKYRNTFPISVTFSDGELPTATKMNGLSSQAKNGLSLVEYAIGDIWNQAGDAVFNLSSNASLMIPNLARYIGASRLTSPRIPYLPLIDQYTYDFTNEIGAHEARVTFPADPSSTFTFAGPGAPTSRKAVRASVQAAGDWWIDHESGDCYFYDVVTSGWKLTYKPVVAGDLGDQAWNVIPDPDQSTTYSYKCVKIQYVNGVNDADGYYIFLPPRGPMNTRRPWNAPQDSDHAPAHVLNYQSGTLGTSARKFWQDSSQPADTSSNAEHYRYCLPKILTDNWSQDATLPAGFLYLWDYSSTGTIIDGLVFKAEDTGTPRKYVLVAEGSALTTWLATAAGVAAYGGKLTSSLHTPTYYPNSGLRLITVGTSISDAFSSLLGQYLDHDHGTQGSLVSHRVKHSSLEGLYSVSGIPQIDASYGHGTGDDHPQYLERHGYNSLRDKYKNMMLGNLVLSSSVAGAGDYENISDVSNRLLFNGGAGQGGSIYSAPLNNCIFIEAFGTGNTGTLRICPVGLSGSDDIQIIADAIDTGNDRIKSSFHLAMEAETGSNTVSGILSTDGFQLKAPSGDYKVDNDFCEIIRSLGPGFGDIDINYATGWAPVDRKGWQCSANSKVVRFYINDLPNQCRFTDVTIYYSITTSNSNLLTLTVYRRDCATDSETAISSTVNFNGTSGAHTVSSPITLTGGVDTQQEMIVLEFTSPTASGETRQIYPYVKFGMYFNLISPWSSG